MSKVVGAQLDKIYLDSVEEREFQFGAEYEDEMGRTYVYARYQDLAGGAATAGLYAVGCDSAYDYWDLTCDSNHADGNDADPRGQIQAALTDGTCGFFQTGGRNRLPVTTDGSVNQDDELVVSGAARGVLVTKGSHKTSVGVARASDGAGTTLAAGEVAIRQARA